MEHTRKFQPTRRRGARLRVAFREVAAQAVSTHAPTRGRDSRKFFAKPFPLSFQPTRPRGARRRVCCGMPTIRQCFNPRAHAGRDRRAALPWRSPRSRFNPRAHAGRDPGPAGPASGRRCFNPRAHAGRDVGIIDSQFDDHVSTHAPTRGATSNRRRTSIPQVRFNPRAHAGRDAHIATIIREVFPFQPTRPRGARRNPRAHAGRDTTHAPTRGATGMDIFFITQHSLFSTHAPTRGAT